jgi:hypothetical protein
MALNNMGVSLMERGDFTAALKTFKDSLTLMKLSATPPTTSQQEQHNSPAVQADEALRLATALLNNLSSTTSCVSSVCPIDDSDVSSMRAALNSGLSRSNNNNTTSTSPTVFPIRLRCTEFETNLDFQAGKVMYNFGLAHLLLYASQHHAASSPVKRPRFQARVLQGSLKNLSLSHCLLIRNINKTCDNNDQFQILCQMLVASLVLNNLYQVFQYQNELPKAQQVLSSLSILAATVDDSIRFVQKCTISPAA